MFPLERERGLCAGATESRMIFEFAHVLSAQAECNVLVCIVKGHGLHC